MNCPKCKSDNVVDGTAGTLQCNACDYSWVPYNTAPRLAGAGTKPKESPAALLVLIFIVVAIAIALGFISLLYALLVLIVGLLAALLITVPRK